VSAASFIWQNYLFPASAQGYGYGYGYGYGEAAIPVSAEEELQAKALNDFFAKSGGIGYWINKDGWNGAAGTQCSWYGISCNNSLVTEINLPGNNLQGTISPSLAEIMSLKVINLGDNSLIDIVPDELVNLTELERLDLRNNVLSGQFPDVLPGMTRLISLDLEGNQFSGVLPKLPSQQEALQHVNFANNNFSGELSSSYFTSQALESINLSHNSLSGKLPTSLTTLKNLGLLKLQNNRFTGEIVNLSALVNLDTLSIGNNRFSPPLPLWLTESSIKFIEYADALNAPPIVQMSSQESPTIDSDGLPGERIQLSATVSQGDGPISEVRWYVNGVLMSKGLSLDARLEDGLQVISIEAIDDVLDSTKLLFEIQINEPIYPTVQILNGLSRYLDNDGIIGESILFNSNGVDPDGEIVQYQWFLNGTLVASEPSATISLPNGSSTIELVARDNVGLTVTQTLETFVEPPVYVTSATWPQAFNGTYPDSAFNLSVNNIGIFEEDSGIIRSCLRYIQNDESILIDGFELYDVNFKVISVQEGLLQVDSTRPFNQLGIMLDDDSFPDCSGEYDIGNKTYKDYIVVGSKVFRAVFVLEDEENQIFKLQAASDL